MKLCFLGDASSIHIRRMAGGLVQRGHSVRVVSHKDGVVPGAIVERFTVPPFGVSYPARWHRRRELYLRRLMREHDVVHIHFLHDWHLTEAIVEHGRLVATPWGSDLLKPPELDAFPPELVAMRRRVLRMASLVVVFGHWFASVVADFADLDPDDVMQMPLGVDTEFFKPESPVRDGRTGSVVGFCKGFKPVYGPEVLIRAIPAVLDELPDTRFELVGAGPTLQRCRDLVTELNVGESVSWLGFQPDEAMPRVMERWAMSAIPSYSESFCVAALEASAMRIPVVGSRVGGLTETVRDGVTGRLVSPGDPEALARPIVDLLENPRLRSEMGDAGRRMVMQDFGVSRTLDGLTEAYERVCSQPASA